MRKIALYLPFLVFILLTSCTEPGRPPEKYTYTIDDQALYDSIIALDSAFFHAYNTCSDNLEHYASFYADSLEFYHDKNGRVTSKAAIVEGTRLNICGKVRRELVEGSIEVYPLPNYGAIEMGLHTFINSEEPDTRPQPGRFTIIWQKTGAGWKIREVISLH